MRADQFNGDDPQNIRPEWRGGQPGEGPYILRVQLTAALASGGNATAKVLDYTGAALSLSDRVITVYDALRLKSGASGDKYWAMWNVDARRWEVLGDSGEKIVFKNTDATEAPAYANMEIVTPGVETVDGVKCITVAKPSGTSAGPHYAYLLNGGSAVAADATGVGYLAYEIPRRVKYRTSDGTPVFGEVWGNSSLNDWQVKPGGPGYLVLGDIADGSFLGVKDIEVRAAYSKNKVGAVTVTTTAGQIVELGASSGGKNCDETGSPTYKIIIKVSGWYAIHAHLNVKANYVSGPKAKLHSMAVLLNGGTLAGGPTAAVGSTYEAAQINLSSQMQYYLAVDDYLQMAYSQDDATDNSQTLQACLSVLRIF